MHRGYSLLEMVIALGIFAFVVVAVTNILVAAKNAQLKAAAIQSVIDNVRFTLETMTKEIRTGSGYALTTCDFKANTQIQFRTQANEAIGYAFYDPPDPDGSLGPKPDLPGGIYKINNWSQDPDCTHTELPSADNPASSLMTSPEVIVEILAMRLSGANTSGSDGQPRLVLSFKAKATDLKLRPYTTMNVETTVTQRLRDANL